MEIDYPMIFIIAVPCRILRRLGCAIWAQAMNGKRKIERLQRSAIGQKEKRRENEYWRDSHEKMRGKY